MKSKFNVKWEIVKYQKNGGKEHENQKLECQGLETKLTNLSKEELADNSLLMESLLNDVEVILTFARFREQKTSGI